MIRRRATGAPAAPPEEAEVPFQDPYLQWAELTQYGYLLHDRKGPLRMAGRLKQGHVFEEVRAVAGVSMHGASRIKEWPYFSFSISDPQPETIGHLLDCCTFVLAEPGMRPAARRAPPCLPRASSASVSKPKRCRRDVVVAVIDGRCGFANESFCGKNAEPKSLIDFFWDQSSNPHAAWRSPGDFSYGRELSGAAITKELKRHRVSQRATPISRAAAERELYRRLRHELPADADWSHGTHILDTILADYAASADAKTRPGLIYVQLPDDALRDTSGHWITAYVLDALRYVMNRTTVGSHVLVNLSLAAFGGPHDGSSLIERAIDDLVDLRKGKLTVVVAAGNAGMVFDDQTGCRKFCRRRVELQGTRAAYSASSAELAWDIDADDTTESFMELWLERKNDKHARPKVTVALRSASAGPNAAVAKPGQAETLSSGDTVIAAVVNATGEFRAPNGDEAMVLVALGHTRSATGGDRAPIGRWLVRVTNEGEEPITLSARIERRDVAGELPGSRPQYGFAKESIAVSGKNDSDTLGSLASGRNTIVVGAAEYDKNSDNYEVCDFSSIGPLVRTGARPNRPTRSSDVYALGKRQSAGFLTGSKKELAGTSMAAAQVTGALAATLRGLASKPMNRGDLIELLSGQAKKRLIGAKGSLPMVNDGSSASATLVLPPPR